ncbi:MAG: helix-turn-helix domain-containing protein [Prevotella sp.]|jgi:excisionase family DNA binding protein|nr:helix-turn-helix domain-containing protein [Prevotella sp.]
MCNENITFDKLPEAVAYLIKEVSELKDLVVTKQNQPTEKRVPIEIEEACRLIMKAKPTVYALMRKGLIPCYKRGKKLFFFEDELMAWIAGGKKKNIEELKEEVETRINQGIRRRPSHRNF